MSLILYNLGWMSWNILLAGLSVLFGYLSLKVKSRFFHIVSTLVFLLFIPNTIYIVTDLAHLIQRWNSVETWVKAVISLQYLIFIPIGFLTFIYSMKLLEKNLLKFDRRLSNRWILILMNFVVALGVVIGRVQRTNSWEIITNPIKVLQNLLSTFISIRLIVFSLMLGLFCSVFYLSVREKIGVGERT